MEARLKIFLPCSKSNIENHQCPLPLLSCMVVDLYFNYSKDRRRPGYMVF
jgi:hypothetical protein